jgi:subtilisin family serine protease
MEANTSRQLARVRLMVGMIAPLVLMAEVVFAGRTIIAFREGTSRQVHRQVVERYGHKVLRHLELLNAVAIELSDAKEEIALAALQSDPWVVRVYKDHRISADHFVSISPVRPPSVEVFPWNIWRIGVPVVSDLITSNSFSTPMVAILDTGIDINHPDLVPLVVGGYNALAAENPDDDQDYNYQDYNGHGTHMAGIIAAEWNGRGIKGIIGTTTDPATDPRLIAVKVLDDTGHGYLSDLINGLEWVLEYNGSVASEQRIRVVNMSLSFSEGSLLLEQVINQLYGAGVIMVASAGNRCTDGSKHGGADDEGGDSGCDSHDTSVRYPAAYPQVTAVVATDTNNKLTDYSRSGKVDLAAPGGAAASGKVLSLTVKGGYGLATGTSQAAAHVSGGVAVALQLAPWLSKRQVDDLLKGTAKDLGYSEPHQGAGLLAVDTMVKKLLGLP